MGAWPWSMALVAYLLSHAGVVLSSAWGRYDPGSTDRGTVGSACASTKSSEDWVDWEAACVEWRCVFLVVPEK
jgi:hypothetical protein